MTMWKRILVSSCVAACGSSQDDGGAAVRVGGTLHGLWTGGGGVALRLTADGVDTSDTVTANGEFAFPRPLAEETPYTVAIAENPASHDCVIRWGGSGIAAPASEALDVACSGPAVSITLSVAGAWPFDPTLDVQPVFNVSVLAQDVAVTVGSPDGAVSSAEVAHEPVSLGVPSAPLPLAFGTTMIDVDLVATGGLSKRYQIALSRAAGVTAGSLASVSPRAGRFTPRPAARNRRGPGR
ncbi:MAG TPA: hypothetical protein VFT22_19900 [Kofleriaceae bacterium]|nr:hypothetical protein [Kofleriaceae bacterium]